MWVLIVQRIAIDFLLHIVYFPVWWYTGGVKKAGLYCLDLLLAGNEYLAPDLWIRNIFVPMFGQTDWQGRLVSFFIRFVNIIFRVIGFILWTAVVIVVFALWLVWPIFVVYLIFALL
ncbi:MAG: hypothetical protein A2725_00150 [Candidatus Magasanikbacteria bacterium RIFCSPHIGHO2_01_FULL_33_34]|uniref:Uncharacterized protein n=1 Tax=Candidatus Magasanikbacteria bacterium RIFCSPHIGHO2_01_FULL_33_34 TaxID=1798671 RepID=A0A1F6LKY3_9BACT|nr:MAG: hypothetical protein A2725_00150 [Candidatus Magasanikbacteria bacterium RIFCSPHIGHO2_01_FULL_33_34]OGH65772.1 MAG: hypothetical protein A3B83_02820 [Candidatus Magasanikbacteria bacterium RIFCSPHIGHO2_02_FULL_33_17]OGH75137.1 MAG: hypothetical protein A3A89_03415 [Candidatus Magasanikbacteria bacterium RIFCSPLOWO2_01_FULL_33_34]OGH81215.1 MAG: hypothetical protein A3F93_04115 [Candidatus Magasanikbacteria bacterium RIFCSPLOWO2_12_FULL_34_7]